MAAPLAMALVLALAADPVVRTDLSFSASAFARAPLPGPNAEGAGGLALTPGAATRFSWTDSTLTARYAPTLWLGADGHLVTTRQALGLTASFDLAPRLSLSARVAASYGPSEWRFELEKEATAADGALQLFELMLPLVPDLLDARAAIEGSYNLTRTLRLDFSAGFGAFGALSRVSREQLPLELGPELYLGLARSLSPITELGTSVYLAESSGSNGHASESLQLRASFTRALGRTVRLGISAGAAATRRHSDEVVDTALSPLAEAELELSVPGRFTTWKLAFVSSFEPRSDPLTGDSHDRAQMSMVARLAVRRLSLSARLGAARERASSEGPGAALALAGAELSYAFRSGLSLGGGAQAGVEHLPGAPASTHWTVFTRAAWTLPNAF